MPEVTTVILCLPGGAVKRFMVKMVLSLMFNGAVEGRGRKLEAFFETTAKISGL